MDDQEPLWDEKEYAAYRRCSLSTVQHERSNGTGPPYLKLGHHVRYRPSAVKAWLDEQTRRRVWEFDSDDAFESVGDAADRVVDKLSRRRS
jgi:predicted DNA-binding transcriptional regulator AlpA